MIGKYLLVIIWFIICYHIFFKYDIKIIPHSNYSNGDRQIFIGGINKQVFFAIYIYIYIMIDIFSMIYI